MMRKTSWREAHEDLIGAMPPASVSQYGFALSGAAMSDIAVRCVGL